MNEYPQAQLFIMASSYAISPGWLSENGGDKAEQNWLCFIVKFLHFIFIT